MTTLYGTLGQETEPSQTTYLPCGIHREACVLKCNDIDEHGWLCGYWLVMLSSSEHVSSA